MCYNTNITQGPGLYHFRATLVDSMSFCNLQAQFTVSEDNNYTKLS